jgi:hypothetical protein
MYFQPYKKAYFSMKNREILPCNKKISVEVKNRLLQKASHVYILIVNLSRYLSSTFGKGFSEANLWNIRQFYLTWSNNEILYTLCRELSWSHIRLIMRLDKGGRGNCLPFGNILLPHSRPPTRSPARPCAGFFS